MRRCRTVSKKQLRLPLAQTHSPNDHSHGHGPSYNENLRLQQCKQPSQRSLLLQCQKYPKRRATTTMMTTMTMKQVVTATMMLGANSPGEPGITSRDRDAIRARKTVGETWRRRRIWWLELVVEVLQLSKLSCSDHAFHSKIHKILESVRKTIVYDSHVLVQSRVMFSASNQSTRSF